MRAIMHRNNVKPTMNHRISSIVLLGTTFLFASSCGGRPQPPLPETNLTTTVLNDTPASALPKCNVNVYIENSASMDGYVKGVTEFEQSIYSYISDIKLADFCLSLNLNYINSKILRQPDDVKDFIAKLEPTTFKNKGGDRSTTDISDLFQKIMAEQGKDDIAILISDFVFSPGKKDASEYLTNQQVGIKTQFATRLKEDPDYAAVLYRLTSMFDGKYFNKFDHPTQIRANRPFFIWLLGNKSQLQRLTAKIKKENMKGHGVDHTFCISKTTAATPYGILSMPRIGTFKIDPTNVKTSILNAKVDKKAAGSKFVVSFGIDYSGFLLEDSYLTDPANYEVNNKAYAVEINRNPNPSSSYTHVVKLKLDSSQPVISRGNIKVSLLKKSAPWAEKYTDNVGEDINADDAMEKTFGLKALVDGVYDAYKSDNTYSSFTININ